MQHKRNESGMISERVSGWKIKEIFYYFVFDFRSLGCKHKDSAFDGKDHADQFQFVIGIKRIWITRHFK